MARQYWGEPCGKVLGVFRASWSKLSWLPVSGPSSSSSLLLSFCSWTFSSANSFSRALVTRFQASWICSLSCRISGCELGFMAWSNCFRYTTSWTNSKASKDDFAKADCQLKFSTVFLRAVGGSHSRSLSSIRSESFSLPWTNMMSRM